MGIGYPLHAEMVVVVAADGADETARLLERVLTIDPGIGILRHVDAGYEDAMQEATRHDLKIPMLKHQPPAVS